MATVRVARHNRWYGSEELVVNLDVRINKTPVDDMLLELVLPLHKIASGKTSGSLAQNRRK